LEDGAATSDSQIAPTRAHWGKLTAAILIRDQLAPAPSNASTSIILSMIPTLLAGNERVTHHRCDAVSEKW
jgi:hypothetical protein